MTLRLPTFDHRVQRRELSGKDPAGRRVRGHTHFKTLRTTAPAVAEEARNRHRPGSSALQRHDFRPSLIVWPTLTARMPAAPSNGARIVFFLSATHVFGHGALLLEFCSAASSSAFETTLRAARSWPVRDRPAPAPCRHPQIAIALPPPRHRA